MPCPELLMNGERNTGVFAPAEVAVCPECGNAIVVQSHAWDDLTGLPLAAELDISCVNDPMHAMDSDPGDWHKYRQSDWESVVDAIRKWTCSIE